MMSQMDRFFVALLPPLDIQDYATQVQQHFAVQYNSQAALKSPPHITLQPPFEWATRDRPQLEQTLETFARSQAPVPVTLDGFGAFPPRVIFINVLKTPDLIGLQTRLMQHLETTLGIVHQASKSRPFVPHLTVAFRDLTKPNFKAGWQEFGDRPLHFAFTTPDLTLLIHNGQRWIIHSEFPLATLD